MAYPIKTITVVTYVSVDSWQSSESKITREETAYFLIKGEWVKQEMYF